MPSVCPFEISPRPQRAATRSLHRSGLTLIEILIALTMTLIVLGAMMSAFQFASAEMQNGRAVLEMSNRMRTAENLLRRDLANLTVDPKPHIGHVIPNGYFEYIEGPRRDLRQPFTESAGSNGRLSSPELSYLGDVDDILAMTVKSIAGQVFRGRRYNIPTGETLPEESSLAEVVWWTRLADSNNDLNIAYTESMTLHRRVLIVNPALDPLLPKDVSPGVAIEWTALSDISVHFENGATPGNVDIVANSLAELGTRQNRAFRVALAGTSSDPNVIFPFHTTFTYPHPLNRTMMALLRSSDVASTAGTANSVDFSGDGIGITPNSNDVVLADVAAFDVRTFSPDCALAIINGQLIGPSDAGFADPTTGIVTDDDNDGIPLGADFDDTDPAVTSLAVGTSQGAFVDLGHHGGGAFSQRIGPGLRPSYYSAAGALGTRSFLNYRFMFEQLDLGSTPFNYATAPASSLMPADMLETVYDTWTPRYENDGINQDDQAGTPLYVRTNRGLLEVAEANVLDQGTDGIDNDDENGPDDYNERETRPPYNEPIRGLQVTLRIVQKQTGQVRQSTIQQSYDVQ